MKKMNKKGFTIVELVVVIAIIAILAAVMIPTFSGVIEKANKSAAMQEAKNALTEDLALLDANAANYDNEAYKKDVFVETETTNTTPASGKTYYTKDVNNVYEAAEIDEDEGFVNGTTYYELVKVSICAGEFSGNGTNYTYTYETDDFKAVFVSSSNEWTVTLK